MKVAIVTDSNSGFSQEQAKHYNELFVIPMPFIVDNKEYFEDINLTQDEFFELLKQDKNVSTSQPSENDVRNVWDSVLKDYDEIVHIPMSSALSASTESATNYSMDYNGKVQVVDNKRISITLKSAVLEAINMAKEGKSALYIKQYLEQSSSLNSIYIMVPTLKYLKKGGRVTPAAAALGNLLGIKPVLTIQCGKLDTFAKVLNTKQAENKMLAQIKKEIENRFKKEYDEGKLYLAFAHTDNNEEIEKFKNLAQKELPPINIFAMDPLPLSIACHIGAKSIAIGLMVSEYDLLKNI